MGKRIKITADPHSPLAYRAGKMAGGMRCCERCGFQHFDGQCAWGCDICDAPAPVVVTVEGDRPMADPADDGEMPYCGYCDSAHFGTHQRCDWCCRESVSMLTPTDHTPDGTIANVCITCLKESNA